MSEEINTSEEIKLPTIKIVATQTDDDTLTTSVNIDGFSELELLGIISLLKSTLDELQTKTLDAMKLL